MRRPACAVLRGEQSGQSIRNFATDVVEMIRRNAEGDASAEIHDSGNESSRCRLRGHLRKELAHLGLGRWRQCVEHRKMDRKLAPLDGVMASPEAIEPTKVGGIDLRGQDQRAGQ